MDEPGGREPDALAPAAPPPAASDPAPLPAAAPARFDNALFFADERQRQGPPAIPEAVFYERPRPPPEVSLAARAALTPLRFALLLFAVGWAGILFQTGFLRQVVFGAPVFEELAKLGLALVPVAAFRIRNAWVRLALGWLSGAAFGVFEHYSTYADEDVYLHAGRVAFHGGTAGLSMAFYHAFEDMDDVRTRWASTVLSTLLHWANNFGAVVLAFAAIPFPVFELVALGWASLVTVVILVLTALILLARPRFEAWSRATLRRAMPRLGLAAGEAGAPPLPPPPVREPEG